MLSISTNRIALAGAALAGTVAVLAVTTVSEAAAAPDNSAAVPVADARAATIAKYGVYPLPVSEAAIAKYKLSKKVLKEIAAAKKFAATPKAKSVRKCESNGNYSISTGNGYYGAYQFDRGTWTGNGGGRYSSTANKAPAFAQDHIAWKTYQQRGWSPWACA